MPSRATCHRTASRCACRYSPPGIRWMWSARAAAAGFKGSSSATASPAAGPPTGRCFTVHPVLSDSRPIRRASSRGCEDRAAWAETA
ncbi:hypothetical protein GBAR_LOCUS18344 [Geodia barretti]|uniref:Uncharacterized protein n=1 Tax=Geodia barretti TaxID=519541 RepID=A0AA35SPQ4_GEOBA|nr:hypothetical protein GBAR_LOCUS18344 [Geodia barretti]